MVEGKRMKWKMNTLGVETEHKQEEEMHIWHENLIATFVYRLNL